MLIQAEEAEDRTAVYVPNQSAFETPAEARRVDALREQARPQRSCAMRRSATNESAKTEEPLRHHDPAPNPSLVWLNDRPEEGEEFFRNAGRGVSDGRGVERGLNDGGKPGPTA